MKRLARSVAMATDHNYHGNTVEVSRVDLYCSVSMTHEQIEIAKYQQEMRLKSMAKMMPHRYWENAEK